MAWAMKWIGYHAICSLMTPYFTCELWLIDETILYLFHLQFDDNVIHISLVTFAVWWHHISPVSFVIWWRAMTMWQPDKDRKNPLKTLAWAEVAFPRYRRKREGATQFYPNGNLYSTVLPDISIIQVSKRVSVHTQSDSIIDWHIQSDSQSLTHSQGHINIDTRKYTLSFTHAGHIIIDRTHYHWYTHNDTLSLTHLKDTLSLTAHIITDTRTMTHYH